MEQAVERVKVCAYCRVSTKEEQQLSSYENQIAYFQREFGDSEEYELTEIYMDRGTSGTKLSRPGFDKMVRDAGVDKTKLDGDYFLITGKPKFNRILVKNTSRFARNVSADLLLKTMKKNGVFVDFLDISKSTENSDDVSFIQLFAAFDERESRDKSKKVLFGIQEGIKRGNIHSNGQIYGYTYYPRPINKLEIIPEEAEVVRLIYELYTDRKMGVQRISEYLTERGILTRKGKPFSHSSLRVILTNEVYTGCGVRQKYSDGLVFEKHPTRKTGHAVIWDTDKVQPIITQATFDEAQRILSSKVQHTKKTGIYSGKTPFAGKLVCGCCGDLYYASGSGYNKCDGGMMRVFACRTKRKMNRDAEGNRVMLCNSRNVQERELKDYLNHVTYWELLRLDCVRCLDELKDIRAVLESHIDRQSDYDVEYEQSQLAEIERKREKLLDLYMDNMLTKEQYSQRRGPLDAEADELKAKIAALSKSNEDIRADISEVDATIEEMEEIADHYKLMIDNESAYDVPTPENMMECVDKIIVEPDGGFTVKLKASEDFDRLVAKHRHLLAYYAKVS